MMSAAPRLRTLANTLLSRIGQLCAGFDSGAYIITSTVLGVLLNKLQYSVPPNPPPIKAPILPGPKESYVFLRTYTRKS